MKKVIVKIITAILIISALIVYIPTISSASFLDNVIKSAGEFTKTENDPSITNSVNDSQILDTTKTIYSILMTAGIIIAAGVILVLGIQIMMGSLEQKAKAKEMLIPFVVGCVVIFGSLTIWRFVVNIASSI